MLDTAMVNGQPNRVVNHHFYQIAAKHAADYPEIVGSLIEQAVLGELKSLDSGGRDVWHPKDFLRHFVRSNKSGLSIRNVLPEYESRYSLTKSGAASMESLTSESCCFWKSWR